MQREGSESPGRATVAAVAPELVGRDDALAGVTRALRSGRSLVLVEGERQRATAHGSGGPPHRGGLRRPEHHRVHPGGRHRADPGTVVQIHARRAVPPGVRPLTDRSAGLLTAPTADHPAGGRSRAPRRRPGRCLSVTDPRSACVRRLQRGGPMACVRSVRKIASSVSRSGSSVRVVFVISSPPCRIARIERPRRWHYRGRGQGGVRLLPRGHPRHLRRRSGRPHRRSGPERRGCRPRHGRRRLPARHRPARRGPVPSRHRGGSDGGVRTRRWLLPGDAEPADAHAAGRTRCFRRARPPRHTGKCGNSPGRPAGGICDVRRRLVVSGRGTSPGR